ncbi:uncharacterized protein LOC115314388 isoform X5 [Ixodes scapularis]|nr:uncharacterized protein LOC115314388 isoform X5 [Ixodes scapularis]
MEPIQSSLQGGGAALLEETSCPLKPDDIWFGCCSCTYVTGDHRGIVSHLVTHGDRATLLGETNYPLKVTEDIWFGCCSCTYVTRDQHEIFLGSQVVPCIPLGLTRLPTNLTLPSNSNGTNRVLKL